MDNSSGASFPPALSYVSFVIGIVSFIITVLNLLALYANFVATIRSAPVEIRDALGNLRAQLMEEREALRQQTRELRNKKAQIREGRRSLHPAHAGRARSSSRNGLSPRPSTGNLRGGAQAYALNYSEQTLGLHYQTVRDLWRQFKSLERPFLVSSGQRAEAIRNGDVWVEKDLVDEKTLREDIELHGESGSFADWSAFYRCDFTHRFIWWQSKSDVVKLADEVQRVMLRRMEREVTCMRMMLKQLRDGGDGPEEIASPRFDGGGGGGGATTSGRAGSRGPVPLGMRRRPTAENYNVYESSESSSSTTGPKSSQQRRPDERDPTRVHVSEVRQNNRPPSRAGPELRYTGEGWRQGQFTRVTQLSPRGTAPPILEPPRPSRPRTRSAYDGPPGPPSPYDRRR
ncbi:hypothetical protein Daus18300_009022 [Diaporthe australafricana]|uniref:Uncharacterized protein n=1 Tax=Diaporthe australafricana TaxID=127596 RepID=A0ABR3WFR2_9PEZI